MFIGMTIHRRNPVSQNFYDATSRPRLPQRPLPRIVVALMLSFVCALAGIGASFITYPTAAYAQAPFEVTLNPQTPIIDRDGTLNALSDGLEDELTEGLSNSNTRHSIEAYMVLVSGTNGKPLKEWGQEFLSLNHARPRTVILLIDTSKNQGTIISNDQSFMSDAWAHALYVKDNSGSQNSSIKRVIADHGLYGTAGRMFTDIFIGDHDYSASNDGNIPQGLSDISETDGWFENFLVAAGVLVFILFILLGIPVLIIRIVRKNRRKTAELQKWQNDLPLCDPSQVQVPQQYQMPNRPGHHMVTDTEYMKNRGYDLN